MKQLLVVVVVVFKRIVQVRKTSSIYCLLYEPLCVFKIISFYILINATFSGGTVHQLKCCAMDSFYYTDCDSFSSNYGVPIDCRDHGDGLILEGQCHSGFGADCHGDFNQVSCCGGHYDGKIKKELNVLEDSRKKNCNRLVYI